MQLIKINGLYLCLCTIQELCINIILVLNFSIKHNDKEKCIQNEIFNNIPHFIKKRLHVDCLRDRFVMYKDKVIISKRELIPPIPDYMLPVDFCKKINLPINNFTTYDMTYTFELFSKKKMNYLYLTESMQTYWLHMLDEY